MGTFDIKLKCSTCFVARMQHEKFVIFFRVERPTNYFHQNQTSLAPERATGQNSGHLYNNNNLQNASTKINVETTPLQYNLELSKSFEQSTDAIICIFCKKKNCTQMFCVKIYLLF